MANTLDRNDLRASVEAATGGRVTVLYTEKGQASYMYKVPRFNREDIDPGLGAGTHPMFIMDGVEKNHRYIGVFPGTVRDGELISIPGVDPAASRNIDEFLGLARANGPGWGLVTNTDWTGLGHWCWANGFLPRGNTDYGRNHAQKFETATRQDGEAPGVSSGTARTLTGSGPASWRHDNTPWGIADLCGNVWEWCPGMRLMDGEIQVVADNDAALSDIDLSAASSLWRAIDGETGDLVATGSANAVKVADSGTADYTLVVSSGSDFEGMTNPGTNPVSAAAIEVLKLYGLYPVGNDLGGDHIWYNLEGERVPRRGGYWVLGENAGVFALRLYGTRTSAYSDNGARPAFAV
ncbi:hypothetical protein [Halomonas sp. OfavH-34-E]|uniref:hypothetical protein n=1 Tax=Halomonas sp. OfavH-34-E TaxID=2954491 RepID=UPI0020978D03|nr:hypothetical protein [Halomonas sp. OfavH-34-E]MCO7215995.1 hypothetical protein [Halomonas sp. OfavH-34-E]